MGNCKSKKEENIGYGFRNNDNNTSQCDETRIKSNLSDVGNFGKTYHQGSLTNEAVIESIKAEVNSLLKRIDEFQGITDNDKNYKYLDEMLTRCILKLDRIECNNLSDRSNRKEAIEGVNQAISILERKLEINSDIKKLASNLLDS